MKCLLIILVACLILLPNKNMLSSNIAWLACDWEERKDKYYVALLDERI